MRTVMVLALLLCAGCAKGAESTADAATSSCTEYASPYMINFSGIYRKADVYNCGSSYKAEALDGSNEVLINDTLTVRLYNDSRTAFIYANFQGQ